LIKKNPKSWEECIAHAKFAYNHAKHRITKQSPFEIVYGFNPPTALDLLPLPLHERVNMDITKRADVMKNLHDNTQKTIEDSTHLRGGRPCLDSFEQGLVPT
jgi:hypothetical protein